MIRSGKLCGQLKSVLYAVEIISKQKYHSKDVPCTAIRGKHNIAPVDGHE